MGQVASTRQQQQQPRVVAEQDECLRTKRAILSFLYEGAPYRYQDSEERWKKRTLAARALVLSGTCCCGKDDELEPMRKLLLSQLSPGVAAQLQSGASVSHEHEVSGAISPMARQIRRAVLQSVSNSTAQAWDAAFPFTDAFDLY
jgi:hypothetical protein